MVVTHKISIDLCRSGVTPRLDAVQGDSNTREVEIKLIADGIPWDVPPGTTAAVAFSKPDGTRGLYDKLPDGSDAVSISGSTVTIILAPQVLTCTGTVLSSVVFYDTDMDTLSTFAFTIVVERNPAAGEQVSNNYYSLLNFDQVNAAYNDLLARVSALEQGETGGGGNGNAQNAALIFTGAVTETYDGSQPVRVEIPDSYTKTEIDTIMGSYITDIDNLVGGGT